MAQSTPEVVAPLNTLTIADVQNSKAKIDKWLKAKTNNNVTLDRVETVARNIPFLGSIFAAVDVVSDVMQIYDKGFSNADIIDWANLGIDAIAIIPGPATATARTMARPALFLVREEIRRITKNGVKKFTKEQLGPAISATIVSVIAEHLSSALAGDVEKFATEAQKRLNSTLTDTGAWVEKSATTINTGIREIVEKGTIAKPDANYKRAEEQRAAIIPRLMNGEILRAGKNIVYHC